MFVNRIANIRITKKTSVPFSRAPLDYKHLSYIAAETSQCGKRAYIKRGRAMMACFNCGLYHLSAESGQGKK